MTTTRTMPSKNLKIDISWGALQRQFFIASLAVKYDVSEEKLNTLYKRLDAQYGNTLTEEEKEGYIVVFCEKTYEINQLFLHYRSLNYDTSWSGSFTVSADQLRTDQLRWSDSTDFIYI